MISREPWHKEASPELDRLRRIFRSPQPGDHVEVQHLMDRLDLWKSRVSPAVEEELNDMLSRGLRDTKVPGDTYQPEAGYLSILGSRTVYHSILGLTPEWSLSGFVRRPSKLKNYSYQTAIQLLHVDVVTTFDLTIEIAKSLRYTLLEEQSNRDEYLNLPSTHQEWSLLLREHFQRIFETSFDYLRIVKVEAKSEADTIEGPNYDEQYSTEWSLQIEIDWTLYLDPKEVIR